MCDQLPDNLILDGRDVAIEPLPMLENNSVCSVPEKTMPITTGDYRGYVAYWELTPQGLYLNRLEGCYQLKSDSPVFADWISAIICPASGTYGEHFAIHIKNGRVLNLLNGTSISQ